MRGAPQATSPIQYCPVGSSQSAESGASRCDVETGAVAAALFDLDGTLVDSFTRTVRAYQATVRDLIGLDPPDDEIVASFRAGPLERILGFWIGRLATVADVEVYVGHVAQQALHMPVYPGLDQALGDLRRTGHRVGVVTGGSARGAAARLDATRLARHVEALVTADDVPNGKPAPDGLAEACRRLAVEPARAFYVGNEPSDMLAADRASVLSVASGWSASPECVQAAKVVARRPNDLAAIAAWLDGTAG
jgi:phosphoglycolate phosphatase-like HAD superfamily hydrolase